jgi:hypothetical protein
MADGPPSFAKLWDELKDEAPLPNEASKEFRRRREKLTNLLERLASEWEQQSKKLPSGALQDFERELLASARTGLDRIRKTGEADIVIRRKRASRAKADDAATA